MKQRTVLDYGKGVGQLHQKSHRLTEHIVSWETDLLWRIRGNGDDNIILSRASEVGSPTNHFGSGQRCDTDQGSFSP